MSIGSNVQRLREERSMTQGELADAIKAHQTHISKIELNKRTPSMEMAQQLATFFGVSLDELINGGIVERDTVSQ